MTALEEDHFLYQSLLRVLAIDSYKTAICSKIPLFEQISRLLALALQNFNELG